jgi:hypothetical protein
MRYSLTRAMVLLLLLSALVVAQATRAQAQENTLPQEQVPRTVVFNGDMTALLRNLADAYNVNLGFEADPRQPKPQINFQVRDATFREVLDAIVRLKPNYQWRESDGFFDLHPATGGSPLLDIIVGNFELKDAGWAEASSILLSLPEVRDAMTAVRVSRREAARGQERGRSEAPFSLRLENVPLRRALHEITGRSGGHFWALAIVGGQREILLTR